MIVLLLKLAAIAAGFALGVAARRRWRMKRAERQRWIVERAVIVRAMGRRRS